MSTSKSSTRGGLLADSDGMEMTRNGLIYTLLSDTRRVTFGAHGETKSMLSGNEMIASEDKETITRLAKRYRVKRLLLFGYSIDPTRESRDIDLAVEGIPSESFFNFYGDLLFSVSKPVDLIDLSGDSKFTRIVRREGLPLYDVSEGTRRS